MKTTIYYGFKRSTQKSLCSKCKGLREEINLCQAHAKSIAAISSDGRAQVSTILETSTGNSIIIRVSV